MRTKCIISGCDKLKYVKGYCTKHYQQMNFKPESLTYSSWHSMKTRCYNPNHARYGRYGGRGIKVCDEWLHNFKAFNEYMGDRPSKRHTLDRIDCNGNYEPGNVRWATWHQQNHNKCNNNKVVGVCLNKNNGKWCAYMQINRKYVLHNVFNNYNDAVKARKLAEDRFGIVCG